MTASFPSTCGHMRDVDEQAASDRVPDREGHTASWSRLWNGSADLSSGIAHGRSRLALVETPQPGAQDDNAGRFPQSNALGVTRLRQRCAINMLTDDLSRLPSKRLEEEAYDRLTPRALEPRVGDSAAARRREIGSTVGTPNVCRSFLGSRKPSLRFLVPLRSRWRLSRSLPSRRVTATRPPPVNSRYVRWHALGHDTRVAAKGRPQAIRAPRDRCDLGDGGH